MAKVNVAQFLQSHKVLVLDTMVFIYQFEANRYFSKLTHQVFKALEAGHCHGIMSSITFHELLVKPKRAGNIPLVLQYTHLLSSTPYLTITSIGTKEAEIGAGLRAKYGLSTPDALVIASGLTNNADGFITADKKLARVKELNVLVLS